MPDSHLVNIEIPAYIGNYTQNRIKSGGKISTITIHHTGGITTPKSVGNGWQKAGRNASSHYGIKDNTVAQYVAESDIAWTNSNWNANKSAITIEICNSDGAPNWDVSDASLQTAIKLVADIAKRHHLYPLMVGQTLTYHSMYTATTCPGPYLLSNMEYIARNANDMIANNTEFLNNTNEQIENVLFIGKAANLGSSKLNVRIGAGTNYNLLKEYPKLNEGNEFEVLEEKDSWYKIRIVGKYIGYVSKKYVTKRGNTQSIYPFAAHAINLGNAKLNVRTGPSTSHELLKSYPQLAQGNQFDVLGESSGWYQIRIAGKYIGWVNQRYVTQS